MPDNNSTYVIEGGAPLRGSVRISGSKNAADYALAATLLTGEECVLENLPAIADVKLMASILGRFGARVRYLSPSSVSVTADAITSCEAPADLVVELRASFLVMGPLLARFGTASSCPPGGDVIGMRPLDVHLAGFRALGAAVERRGEVFVATAKRLRAARVTLDYPSVMGTLNVTLAAVLADGTSTIINAAAEPEVVDLVDMLNAMGARIRGGGTHTLEIEGVRELHGVRHRIVSDRLEAGTFALAAAITGGDVELRDALPGHLDALISKMQEAGAEVEGVDGSLRVCGTSQYRAVSAQAVPYPGLATDLHPPLAAFLTQARGVSVIHERVFDNRLLYIGELRKMGADVITAGQTALISGPTPLYGTRVRALDVRAGDSVVLAALAAEGRTEIADVYHIDRAHEALDDKLRSLGARIERV